MRKLTSHVKKLSSNLDDVRKLQPDLPNVSNIKPDLSKVRKIVPNLNDLRQTLVPDLEKIQEMSLSLEKVTGRLPDLDDFGNMAKRWGDMGKLVPQWGNNKDAISPEVTLSESEEKEGFKKIQDVLDAPKAHNSVQESMEDAKDSIANTLRAFQRVGAALAEATGTADAKENINDLSRFSDAWSTHQKEFVRLLRVSRETASRAHATASKFAFDLVAKLGDDTLSTDEKSKKIREYQANLEVEMDQSNDLEQGFEKLHTQVTDFQKEITVWMKKGGKLKEDILKLAADIKKAKEGIEKLTRQALLSASSALGLGILSAGAVALGILCPLLWIGAAVRIPELEGDLLTFNDTYFPGIYTCQFASVELVKDGRDAWNSLVNRKGKKVKLQGTEHEMDDKLASLEEFKSEHIQVILGSALSDLNLICDKLWVISKIWRFICADLVEIEKRMDLAKGRAWLLKARLKAAASTYSLLSNALSQYETAIGGLTLGDE